MFVEPAEREGSSASWCLCLEAESEHRTLCGKEGQDDQDRRLYPNETWAMDLERPELVLSYKIK